MRGILTALVLALGASTAASAQQPMVDLSQHQVSITTGFAGSEVLLFGAVDLPSEIVIVVRGPAARETVRRKERIAGLWINRGAVTFADAPGYYHVATSAPLETILTEQRRVQAAIGLDGLDLHAEQPSGDTAAFRAALVRIKQEQGLYDRQPGKVEFIGSRLFRSTLVLPANVPTGTYQIAVFGVGGAEIARTSLELVIGKVGFEAALYNFARAQGLAYGLIAVGLALVTGWLASLLFRST